MTQEIGIGFGDDAVDPQTDIGPAANPVTVMQVRVTGVAIAYERFVIATARAHRPRPACVAFRFAGYVSALEETALYIAIHAGRDVPEPVRVGIDKAVAGSDIARRSDADEPEPGAARVRLADTGVQLADRVADVRE